MTSWVVPLAYVVVDDADLEAIIAVFGSRSRRRGGRR